VYEPEGLGLNNTFDALVVKGVVVASECLNTSCQGSSTRAT